MTTKIIDQSFCIFLSFLLSIIALHEAVAATPGLPFTEDFSADNLIDKTKTTADINTEEQAVRLAFARRQFGVLVDPPAFDISSDQDDTNVIAVGDVNGDGHADLVAGNRGVNKLYLNTGSNEAPFANSPGIPISMDEDSTESIALGDVDGDGDLDIIAGNSGLDEDAQNRLYLNNGTENPFANASGDLISEDEDDTNSIALGDVDGDGDLDVIAGNEFGPNRLYLNNGTKDPFTNVTGTNISEDGDSTLSVALGDMDGDGDMDVVAGNGGFEEPNRLYLNNGTETPFENVNGDDISTDSDDTQSIALGDVDGDGDLDVLVGNTIVDEEPRTGINRLYLNNGTETPFENVTGTNISDDGDFTASLALGDVDGDGDLDVVAGNNGANRIYLNDGTKNPFSNINGSDISEDGDFTESIALSDVDGDGDLDVLAGNFSFSDTQNRLYLNNGSSNPFGNASGLTITDDGDKTSSMALGDIDSDGDLDVVAGNAVGSNRLYLNNGTENPFANVNGTNITDEDDFTADVALGDVDGDDDLDVIVGNFESANRLYLNNGTENPFANVNGTNISDDEDNTVSIALSDVDDDGDLDVVVGNRGEHFDEVSRLYLNNGTANPFANVNGLTITDDNDLTDIALGDVDSDGDLDVVVGKDFGANRLYLNNGTENPFADVSGINITDDDEGTEAIALGDMDGDGDLDVITGNSEKVNRLYLNNGTENPFANVNGLNITEDDDLTGSITLGDVDGDGDLDVVAGNSGSANRLYLNNGTESPFANANGLTITEDDDLTSMALGDVDGDGDLDVVTGNWNQPNRLYLNNGPGNRFANISATPITDDKDITSSIALGDIDGDGDLDIVSGNSGANRLYLNNASKNPFENVNGITISEDDDRTFSIALGDVDGDGDLDVIAGNSGANRLYLNNGTANPFANVSGANISDDSDSTSSIALGDVDGDGDLDVVAGNFRANRLYLNNGTEDPFANVNGTNISDDSFSNNSLALGDMDGDGDLDVVVGNREDEPNRLYLNNGTEDPFANVNGIDISFDFFITNSIALGDVDGDGDLDIVSGNSRFVNGVEGDANNLYLNNGTADPFTEFEGISISNDSHITQSITLDDVDGDGDLDVVSGNEEGNRLYFNNGSENPFTGETGALIAPVSDNTQEIVVGDVNGDGFMDVVTANSRGPNYIYYLFSNLQEPTEGGLQTHLGAVVSQTIDDKQEPIHSTTLTAVADIPLHSQIDLYLSNNGGQKWHQVQSGESFLFPTTGSDLRWRAELQSFSPAITPKLTSVSVTTDSIPSEAPEAPSNLSAKVLSAASISLEWEDNSDNEMRFRIDRKTADGSFSEIATVDANIISHTDEGLQAETEYSYRVRAENSAGNSNYSNTETQTTLSDSSPFPIVLQGNSLPEKVTVELSASKPSEPVVTARLILEVFDADKANEGELNINGNGPIRLFGKLKSPENNRTTARLELMTPADWWQDGVNTLEFIHTRSGGYRVESGVVEFDESSAGFPLVLQGRELPEEATIVLKVSKPAEVSAAVLNLTVFDADKTNEGELIINGNSPIRLFGKLKRPENNRATVTLALSTPSEWWQNGDNTLRFIHTRSGGYRVENATVDFNTTAKPRLASDDSKETVKSR